MPNRLGKGISALLVLATLCGVLAFVSTWTDRQLFETGHWADTSAELIDRPEIRDAVSTFLVERLLANVDVQAELQADLPPKLRGLAGPAAAALRKLSDRAADKALDSPKVRDAWVTANTAAHETAMQIIEGGNAAVGTRRGVVTIDLRLILTDLAERVGVNQRLIAKLPPDAGTVVVLHSDDLKTAQNVHSVVSVLAVAMTLLTILLFASAIGLATGRRQRAVAFTGASLAVVGGGALILESLAKGPLVDSLVSTQAVRPTVVAVYEVSTRLFREQAGLIIIFGVLVMLGAGLAGALAAKARTNA